MADRRWPWPKPRVAGAVLASAVLLLLPASVSLAAEEDYAWMIPDEIQACARMLAWTSGDRHRTHIDERWSVRENSPREMCDECHSPMCVVCMEYDLDSYESRPGVSVELQGCVRTVQRYLRSATHQETEVLAAIYWIGYWDGRHGRPLEPPIVEPLDPVAGRPGLDGETEFLTPFISGVTSLLVTQIVDSSTGESVDPADVAAEFLFRENAQPPFVPEDLLLVVLSSPGYASRVIGEWTQGESGLVPVSTTHLTSVLPVVQLLAFIQEEKCKTCTLRIVNVLKDGAGKVTLGVEHCEADRSWKPWSSKSYKRHTTAPSGKCPPDQYWLQYEQVSDMGVYTLWYCNADGQWEKMTQHAVRKTAELPKVGEPGKNVIVVTESKAGKRTYIKHELYVCTSDGKAASWRLIGSWVEVK